MSLVDISVPQQTITDVANEVRGKLAQIVSLADIRLLEIRNLVRKHGRQDIANELGSDAAAMLTVYTKLKEAIETAKEVAVEDLPT